MQNYTHKKEVIFDMLEIMKIVANFGFPATLCIYLLWSYGKKLDKLDDTIGNHLTHALKDNTEATKKDSESGARVERAINNLATKISEFLEKKLDK